MCFCATASFTAAGGLTLVSAALLARKPSSAELPMAFIPLGFAVQQAIEGALWNSLHGDGTWLMPLTLAFLFFAAFWWPFYLPFTAWRLEPPEHGRRRLVLAGATGAGGILGAVLYTAFLIDPTPAEIVGDSISHTGPRWIQQAFFPAYVFFTTITFLLSSRRILQVYGALALLALFLAGWLYLQTLFSVWCFFAAVLSGLLLCARPVRSAAT